MNNRVFEIDMIINNNNYSRIYSFVSILLLSLLIVVYIIFTYDYHTYYQNKGIIIFDDEYVLKIYSNIKDTNLILNNSKIEIEGEIYNYQVSKLEDNIYVSEDYENYQTVYLKVDNLKYLENMALNFKIEKKKQKIIYHILDYLERR